MIHPDIIKRYDEMLSAYTHRVVCEEDSGTTYPHLRWMLREMATFTDEGKAFRWLGFVQGIMIERGLTSVLAERNFTRPYFIK